MAKLNLKEHSKYEIELVLVKIRDHDPHWIIYDYHLTVKWDGVNVFGHWQKLVHPEEPSVMDGILFLPTTEPFDDFFRPLLTEECPIRMTDWEGGQWMTITAWPSAFLHALQMRDTGSWEYDRAWMSDAVTARIADHRHLKEGKKVPKQMNLERDDNYGTARFSFQFTYEAMNVHSGNSIPSDGYGMMAFDAYVRYDALERFLNELEAERKVLKKQHEGQKALPKTSGAKRGKAPVTKGVKPKRKKK